MTHPLVEQLRFARFGVAPGPLTPTLTSQQVGWAVSSERRNIHDEQSGQD
jgi:hypothetical protein